MYERCGAIVNRVVNPELVSYIQIKDIPVLAYIDSDEAHAVNDIQGRSVFDLPADAPLLLGAREALQKLEIWEPLNRSAAAERRRLPIDSELPQTERCVIP